MAIACDCRASARANRDSLVCAKSYRRYVGVASGRHVGTVLAPANERRASQCFDAPERRRTFAHRIRVAFLFAICRKGHPHPCLPDRFEFVAPATRFIPMLARTEKVAPTNSRTYYLRRHRFTIAVVAQLVQLALYRISRDKRVFFFFLIAKFEVLPRMHRMYL